MNRVVALSSSSLTRARLELRLLTRTTRSVAPTEAYQVAMTLQVGLWRSDGAAGALWVPYVLWVSFATALNAAIVRLN